MGCGCADRRLQRLVEDVDDGVRMEESRDVEGMLFDDVVGVSSSWSSFLMMQQRLAAAAARRRG